MKYHVSYLLSLILFTVPHSFMYRQQVGAVAQQASTVADTLAPALRSSKTIKLADPTIFYHKGMYYLYGTGGDVSKGFLVYTSKDLVQWEGPKGNKDGYALIEGDAFGTNGFWAPQVFERNGRFYMAYTANEQIAIAESESPLGPFKQKTLQKISGPGKQIDPFIFFDDDGRVYLFHVRLDRGNRIYVAELKSDLSDIITGTEKECINAADNWENTSGSQWPVAEGPTVIKRGGKYYLLYSANDYRNIDYAVGYAISDHVTGPWKKSGNNPILDRKDLKINGTGHGDLFRDDKGNLQYVFHTHFSETIVQPRLTGIVKVRFKMKNILVDTTSFRYLEQVN